MKKLTLIITIIISFSLSASELKQISSIDDVFDKKTAFFAHILPLVMEAQREVEQERNFVLSISEDGYIDTPALDNLKLKYRVVSSDILTARNELLKKVNIIPVNLVLNQAANESGWGSSRFAQKGFNLFGVWCYQKGCGLKPLKRSINAKHEVKRYSSIKDSIASYMYNLNVGQAYIEFRKQRFKSSNQEEPLNGYNLAKYLSKYSERGDAYTNEIRSMIRINKKIIQKLIDSQ